MFKCSKKIHVIFTFFRNLLNVIMLGLHSFDASLISAQEDDIFRFKLTCNV